MTHLRFPDTGDTRAETDDTIVANLLRKGWQEFTPAPPPPPPVPEEVTNAQFRVALIESGIMPAQVDGAIAAIPDAKAKAIAVARWEYANHIRRSDPLIAALAPAFGLTSAAVDQLFFLAATK